MAVGALVAAQATEQQFGRGAAERIWILGDHCQAGVDHVAEWDVVEADVRDGVLRGELVKRAEVRRS